MIILPSEIPTQNGRVDYVVPVGTWVAKHDHRIYAEPGDHIHGFSSKVSLELGVWEGNKCPHHSV